MFNMMFETVNDIVKKEQSKMLKKMNRIENRIEKLQTEHATLRKEYTVATRIAGKLSEILYIQGEEKHETTH